MPKARLALPKAAAALLTVALVLGAPAAYGQVVEPLPAGGGMGGIGAAGAAVTVPTMPLAPSLNTTLGSAPSLSAAPSAAPPAAQAAPATAAPAVAAPAATARAKPASSAPLLSATGLSAGGDKQCDLSEVARETCSGPNCLLSCAADACDGEENSACDFVIDCAAEITAEIASGEQPCDEGSIEQSSIASGSGNVAIIHLAAGESCKPPPCMK